MSKIKTLQDLIDKSILKSLIMEVQKTPHELRDSELCYIYFFNKKDKITDKVISSDRNMLSITTPNGTKIELANSFINQTLIVGKVIEFVVQGTPISVKKRLVLSATSIDNNINSITGGKFSIGKTVTKIYDLHKKENELKVRTSRRNK